jgi:Cu-processing system permease protein
MCFSSISYDCYLAIRMALRARFATIALLLLLAISMLAFLAGLFSARQPATVSLDVGLSLLRFAMPLLVILMSQELISKEFEQRYYLVSLTYPRHRAAWFIARFLAVFLLGLSALLLTGAVLAALVSLISSGYAQTTEVDLGLPYLVTLGMMAIDLFVITSFAAMLAVIARTPSFVLIGSVGFMLIARSYASVVSLLDENIDPILSRVVDQEAYKGSLSILQFLLPDLGSLDVRYISLYGQMTFLPAGWVWSVIGVLGYSLVLLGVAIWWMDRRRFG